MAMVVCGPAASRAQLSPGPLSRSHGALEGLENCSKCHDPNASQMGGKCLECHTSLRARVENRQGLHGHENLTDCAICHVEHQGLDFELIWWDNGMAKFDHNKTGYALTGGHSRVECRQCHQVALMSDTAALRDAGANPQKTFLGLNTTCASCHFDEHRGQLAGACTDCHTTNGWRPAPGFNHDKTTFALTGKHRETNCEKCHELMVTMEPGDPSYLKFGGRKRDECIQCHVDKHEGRLGKDCERCHTTADWKSRTDAAFDHGRTRYPLQGRHAQVACDKCHPKGRPVTGLRFATCTDCHNDVHNGEFADRPQGMACESCHTVNGFSPAQFTFQNHDATAFPLRGAHGALICRTCHSKNREDGSRRSPRFSGLPVQCAGCHSDIHEATAVVADTALRCQVCHNEDLWTQVEFEHAMTGYELKGLHARVACLKCHPADSSDSDKRIIRLTAARACAGCHADIHRGQFAKYASPTDSGDSLIQCNHCHTPEHWRADLFEHNRDARYKLDGAHERVACAGCHTPEPAGDTTFVNYFIGLLTCRDCHAGDSLKTGEGPQ